MSKRILTIKEIEARNALTPNFGKGITVASGFDLGAKAPLDSRFTVKTLEERDAHITGNRAYEGMLVYVEADKKTYQLIDDQWVEFGFSQADFEGNLQGSIIDNLESDDATKALSARQGKVLKGLIDGLQIEVNGLDQALEDEIAAREAVEVKVGELETALNELTVRVEANEAKLAGITGTVTGAIETAKQGAIDAAKEYVDEKVDESNGRLDVVEGRLDVVEPKVEANAQEIAGVKQSIEALEQKDVELKAEIDAAVERVEANETAIGSLETNLEQLEQQVGNLTSDVDTKIEAAKNEAVTEAGQYTDEKIAELDEAYKLADQDILKQAKEYADEKDAETLAAAELAAQELVDELEQKIVAPQPGQELNVKFGDVVVAGNLEVKGSVKSIERTELHVEDTMIELNSTGADVTTSDVHLGLRANLGEGRSSELVYCPDTQKWIVKDGHPATLAKHGAEQIKTIAFVEDVEAGNAAVEEKVEEVVGRVDALEPKVEAVEEKLETVEEEIAALKAVENVTEKVTNPANTMTLAKTPFGGKVELFINGLLYTEGFTVSDRVISWNGEFEIESDDTVVAKYTVK